MTWLHDNLATILGVVAVISEALGFTPYGGIVKSIAQLMATIFNALAGNPPK